MMCIGAPQRGQTKVACGGAGVSLIVVVGAVVSDGGRAGQQLTGAAEVALALRAGVQAVVADAVEAARQDVQQEAA